MRVDAIYGAIGRFSVRFRWLVLLDLDSGSYRCCYPAALAVKRYPG